MAAMDDEEDDFAPCKYWDEDGCYCICGSGCTCMAGEPAPKVVDIGDELHRILGEALKTRRGT